MGKTGVANLPLHGGKAPRWLYQRMVKMADAISGIIIEEYGEERLLELISNPHWFQAFSCVLGYDWHSSGTTTVTTAALKEALTPHDIAVAGGKGMARKTLGEIEEKAAQFDIDARKIQYASRMAAKVDSAALQDGYHLYHHAILFTRGGAWAVVQQGMNTETKYARRYHWLWKVRDFVDEPHAAIVGIRGMALDMTARKSDEARKMSVDIAREKTHRVMRQLHTLTQYQQTLDGSAVLLSMPRRINWAALREVYEIQPRNYEELLAIRGVGPATVRALAYTAELIYGTPLSWEDPVKFSFAVGGKDGVPYPVHRRAMDEATRILRASLEESQVGREEKMKALRRLRTLVPE